MKKFLYVIPSLAIIAVMQSCDKHLEHASKQIVIDTTLASTVEYQLDLKPYGDADDVAAITKQASDFTRSEIVNDSSTFAPVYHFSALAKTTITDQVVLSIKEGNHGNGAPGHYGDSATITINFTIK